MPSDGLLRDSRPKRGGDRTAPSRVVATAPARIDLAGGTIDIWPLSVIVPGAVTVNVALELRATAEISTRTDGRVAIFSRDRRRRTTRRLPVHERRIEGPLALLLRLVHAFHPERGLSLTTTAEAPAGAGLGGSSALGIAVGAALNRFTGARLGKDALLRRVMNLEAVGLGVPTGNQDYLAALHGGLSIYHHGPDGTVREALPVPSRIERRLVLAYTGQPRQSGFSNWEMFRRFVERKPGTVRRMEAIARIAKEMGSALRRSDLDVAGRLLGEEGRLRASLAPSVVTPLIRRIDTAARRAGALGAKVCGAGGGGCVVAFAAAGRERAVAEAVAATGARLLPVGIARRGLRISER